MTNEEHGNLMGFLAKLAVSPSDDLEFRKNPEDVMAAAGLSDEVKSALQNNDKDKIRALVNQYIDNFPLCYQTVPE